MPYTKHRWVDGESITASKLNNIKEGIAEASQGQDLKFATVTLNHDFSLLDKEEYDVDKLYFSIQAINAQVLWNSYYCTSTQADSIVIPMFENSMQLINVDSNLIDNDTGTIIYAYAQSFESLSENIVYAQDYGIIVNGNGSVTIIWKETND